MDGSLRDAGRPFNRADSPVVNLPALIMRLEDHVKFLSGFEYQLRQFGIWLGVPVSAGATEVALPVVGEGALLDLLALEGQLGDRLRLMAAVLEEIRVIEGTQSSRLDHANGGVKPR
jgi:hypothetical protein